MPAQTANQQGKIKFEQDNYTKWLNDHPRFKKFSSGMLLLFTISIFLLALAIIVLISPPISLLLSILLSIYSASIFAFSIPPIATALWSLWERFTQPSLFGVGREFNSVEQGIPLLVGLAVAAGLIALIILKFGAPLTILIPFAMAIGLTANLLIFEAVKRISVKYVKQWLWEKDKKKPIEVTNARLINPGQNQASKMGENKLNILPPSLVLPTSAPHEVGNVISKEGPFGDDFEQDDFEQKKSHQETGNNAQIINPRQNLAGNTGDNNFNGSSAPPQQAFNAVVSPVSSTNVQPTSASYEVGNVISKKDSFEDDSEQNKSHQETDYNSSAIVNEVSTFPSIVRRQSIFENNRPEDPIEEAQGLREPLLKGGAEGPK